MKSRTIRVLILAVILIGLIAWMVIRRMGMYV
jgi:hypothetical protein